MKPCLYLGLALGVVALIFTAVLFAVSPLKYKRDIRETAGLYNVDPVLVAAVINAESSFIPNAVSPKGAIGLMQIMPETAEWVAKQIRIEVNAETLKDPHINILIGTFYLDYLMTKFGDVKTALIAYNAGEGKVNTWLTDTRYAATANTHTVLTSCPYPSTNKYVEKVLNGKNFYKARF
jgi:soluble lytic murein transglycosylase